MFNIFRLGKSFGHASRGFFSLIREEQNFRVHLVFTVLVIVLGLYFHIPVWQWCLIILMIMTVLVLEILNTIFEKFLDMLKPRLHEYVGEIKDMLSAMVLVAAVASAIVGLIIFVPYLYS